jgi:hypothetical protein
MTENAPLVTLLCSQCRRHAQVRRGEPLPEGWIEHVGQLSCSETCRELLQSIGLMPEEEMHSARRSGDEDVRSSVSESRSTTLPPKELRSSSEVYAGTCH